MSIELEAIKSGDRPGESTGSGQHSIRFMEQEESYSGEFYSAVN